MKKLLSGMVGAGLLAVFISLVPASSAKADSWTGWISDSGCGAAVLEKKADHKACAVKCVKDKGAKYVFVNSATKEVVPIHNQDAVSDSNVGMEVKVTGDVMDDKSIHVEKIEAAGGM